MLRNKRAFTLLESLVALLVTGLVLTLVQLSIPLLKSHTESSLDIKMFTISHQIETQKYSLISADKHRVSLKSSDGKLMHLEVYKNKLQLSANGAGQIILAPNINQLNVTDKVSHLQLELVDQDAQRANSILYLRSEKKHD